MTSRRDALRMLAVATVAPLAVCQTTSVELLVPVQLNADGTGWFRDLAQRKHPVGPGWVDRVTDLRLNGVRLDHCVEFNLEENWARCIDYDEGHVGEILRHGKITVDWHRG